MVPRERPASSTPSAVPVVLVEDDERLATRLRGELSGAGYLVRWARTGEAGLDMVARAEPRLVLLDLNLPGRSGFQTLATLRETTQVPVIVLTARAQGVDKVRALDLGADDYLTKPFWTEELVARIRAVLRRHAPSRPAGKMTFGDTTLDLRGMRVERGGQPVSLTLTQLGLLVELVRRPGRVVLHDTLIERVLPGDASDIEALQAQVSRLRKKLGPDGARIATVRGLGYRFDADREAGG